MSRVVKNIQTAKRMLDKKGEPVILKSPTQSGGYDPVTGDPLPGAQGITIEANCAPTNYTAQEIDGTNILSTDGKIILAATNPRVEIGWTAELDGLPYRVVNVTVDRESGMDIIQTIQVRL